MISELQYRMDCDNLSAAQMIKKYGIGCFTLVESEFKPGMVPEHFKKSNVDTKELLEGIEKNRRKKIREKGTEWFLPIEDQEEE